MFIEKPSKILVVYLVTRDVSIVFVDLVGRLGLPLGGLGRRWGFMPLMPRIRCGLPGLFDRAKEACA